jgi:hypothetical protein
MFLPNPAGLRLGFRIEQVADPGAEVFQPRHFVDHDLGLAQLEIALVGHVFGFVECLADQVAQVFPVAGLQRGQDIDLRQLAKCCLLKRRCFLRTRGGDRGQKAEQAQPPQHHFTGT